MRKAEPTNTTSVVAQSIGRGVTRSLYRSLLQEANKLDKATVSKVLLPVPRKLQVVTGLTGPLYVPNGIKYADVVKRAFKMHKPGEPGNPLLAFEALNMFRAHAKTVENLMTVATKEHDNMVKALGEANPDAKQYWAKPILDPVQMQRIQQERMEEELIKSRNKRNNTQNPTGPQDTNSKKATEKIKVGVDIPDRLSHRSPQHEQTIRDLYASTKKQQQSSSSSSGNNTNSTKADVLAKLGTVEPRVGMGLVAHPLSSSHIDRRVILIVDTNPQTTTGLVLDMFYTYPLSHGNPMFPEVFWGHEVYNGGYCHVDFTMPPTANVSILHTLPPPSETNTNASYNARWLSWALGQATGSTSSSSSSSSSTGNGGDSGSSAGAAGGGSPTQHHERLCKPIILGNGKDIPTLYCSKVEALPYLSSLVPGQARSDLRVYWGCMRWSTIQLTSEIKNGHWIPVDISSRFFAAYPVVRPGCGDGGMSQHVVDTFPTEDMLRESKDLRTKLLGADVVPPQTFPPDQPVCRRESLWDQIVYALGGEYRSLVGSVNPFVTKQQQQRAEAAGTSVDTGAAPPRRLAESAQHLTPPPPPPSSTSPQAPLPSASNNNNNSGEQKSTAVAAGVAAATSTDAKTNKSQQEQQLPVQGMVQKRDNHVEDEIEVDDDGYLESREGAAILTDEDDLSEMDIEEMIDVLDPDNHHSVRRMISTSVDADNGLIHEDDHLQVEAAMRSNLPPPSNENKKKNGDDGDDNKSKPPSV